ncbi:GspH/FimT family pseudopilin [Halomonas nitroreducens]|uniref:Type II secretion system protein H n=1 Tax=Halomonas nitroreducens TaxID=447425 RepID=A0A3S0HS70_9GAMM|nr:GspH/FimT family pseudopilin [Halomonas nitroreducens]RTR01454.1 prepilin-type N-terminal cleavage/methylation domain-containing protein [Halomonas nitroreducens]
MGQETADGLQLTGRPPAMAKPAQRGLTLIELLVALAVVILMATWGVPSFQQFAARNEVAAEVMRIKTALALARNTAVMRRTTIAVCASSGPPYETCTFDDWDQDWVIVEGEAVGGDLIDIPVLRVLHASETVDVSFNRSDRPVRYSSLGRSQGYNGTFDICSQKGESAAIILNNLGRTRAKGQSSTC